MVEEEERLVVDPPPLGPLGMAALLAAASLSLTAAGRLLTLNHSVVKANGFWLAFGEGLKKSPLTNLVYASTLGAFMGALRVSEHELKKSRDQRPLGQPVHANLADNIDANELSHAPIGRRGFSLRVTDERENQQNSKKDRFTAI